MVVIPAKAGISVRKRSFLREIPAFAGMTKKFEGVSSQRLSLACASPQETWSSDRGPNSLLLPHSSPTLAASPLTEAQPMTALATRPSQHDALGRLTDRRLLRELAYVDGRWTAAANGAVFEVADPATGVTVARVARLGAAEADRAIAAAEAAFPAWRA